MNIWPEANPVSLRLTPLNWLKSSIHLSINSESYLEPSTGHQSTDDRVVPCWVSLLLLFSVKTGSECGTDWEFISTDLSSPKSDQCKPGLYLSRRLRLSEAKLEYRSAPVVHFSLQYNMIVKQHHYTLRISTVKGIWGGNVPIRRLPSRDAKRNTVGLTASPNSGSKPGRLSENYFLIECREVLIYLK